VNSEAQKVLTDAASVRNVGGKHGRLTPATRYLRFNERRSRQVEAKRLREQLDPMNLKVSGVGIDSRDAQECRKHLNTLERELEENSPPIVGGEAKDALYRRSQELQAQIQVGMLSREDMRRNPVGAVDKHVKWERANKDRILEWKNLQLMLEPDDESQDLCNIESFRPESYVPGQPATFNAGAQIPGAITYSHIPDEKWEDTFGSTVNENSPLAAAERRELEELRALKAAQDAKKADLKQRMSVGSKKRWQREYERRERQGERDLKKLQAQRVAEAVQEAIAPAPEE